jgi:transcriptional regulator with XRE-family HTH domain
MKFHPDEIRAERLRRGLSQTEAAEQLGTTKNTWARWERGERHPTGLYLRALAQWMSKEEEGGEGPRFK